MGNVKRFLENLVNTDNLKETGLNLIPIFAGLAIGNIISNKYLGYNLGRDNALMHTLIGAGLGAHFYRAAGGGWKGLLAAAAATTGFNLGWESLEYFGEIYGNVKPPLSDIKSDMLSVYAGGVFGIIADEAKKYFHKRNEKWVL